jgi:hypothetical protein
MRVTTTVLSIGLLVGGATTAAAQQGTTPPVSQLVPELTQGAAVIFGGPTGGEANHFVPGVTSLATLDALQRAIGLQVADYPLGPIAGGLVNRGTGPDRRPGLFGASYVAHGWTHGAGRLAFTMGFQDTAFDAYDGLDIRGSDVNVFATHLCCTADASDRDLMQQTVSLRMVRQTTAFALTYGVTDRFDVGVVVPFVEVAADARVLSRILRTATAADPNIHVYDVNQQPIDLASRTFPSGTQPPLDGALGTGASTARGFGDIVVRGKFALLQSDRRAAAIGLDIRLPSGSTANYIGLGLMQVTPSIALSAASRRVGVRAEASSTFTLGTLGAPFADASGSAPAAPRELGFAAGLDVPVAPRTRLSFDVIGRQLSGVPSFATETTVFSSRGPGSLPSADFVAVGNLVSTGTETVSTVQAAAGGRLRISDDVLVGASAFFPLTQGGLRPAATAVLSLDYGF